MWSRGLVVAGVLLGVAVMQSPASAESDIIIPVDTVVQSLPGEMTELGEIAVESDLVGATCTWSVTAQNQESVHLGNDIILSTNGTDSVIAGVEDQPDLVSTASDSVELGETITVSLKMGPDAVFSGGVTVAVDCQKGDDAEVKGEVVTSVPTVPEPPTAPEAPAPAPAQPTTPTAQPAVAQGQLALTGPSHTTWMLVLAGSLIAGGLGLMGQAARFER